MLLRMKRLLFALLAGCASQATPPPAAPAAVNASEPAGAEMMAPSTVAGYRVKGDSMIAPDDMDKWAMAEHEVSRVTYSGKICIGTDGHVASIRMLQSTGIPGYDRKIQRRISEWEYSPFMVNGRPVAVCTGVTMIYNQANRR